MRFNNVKIFLKLTVSIPVNNIFGNTQLYRGIKKTAIIITAKDIRLNISAELHSRSRAQLRK
jgi:hypothetical protein